MSTLEQQAAVPITNPFEMASLSWPSVTLCDLVSCAQSVTLLLDTSVSLLECEIA